MVRRFIRIAFEIIIIFALFMNQALADVAVIVSIDNAVSGMKANTIKKIFLGKTKTFTNGTRAHAVYQKDGTNAHRLFRDALLKKSAVQLKSFWFKRLFSGKSKPPNVLESDNAVISYVVNTPGGIGYIDAAKVDKSVKVILTIKGK